MPRICSALIIAISVVGLFSPASAATFPLKLAENRRFLVDQKGEPFLVVGDTAWSLIGQLGQGEIDRYLEDRRKRGFNSIIVNLIEHKFCTDPPRTHAGLAPFAKQGDFSTPSPYYFNFAHKVVKQANDHGIIVWLFPAYLGFGGGDEGWFREMKASGRAKLRTYGRFVGRRFVDLPNIIWVLGGDFTPKKEDEWTIAEVAEGILEEDSKHLMSGHGSPGDSAIAALGDQKWLAINSVYSYSKTLFRSIQTEHQRFPIRAFVLMESTYEGEHDSTPEQIRRQAYWAILGGACGQFFGNNPIWHFNGPGLFPANSTWPKDLDGTGSRDMARLGNFFNGLPWHQLKPEKNHAIVISGYGLGIDMALTAQTPDSKLSVTYFPSTGRQSRKIEIDPAQFSGPIHARWFNPTNGQWTLINQVPLGDRSFYSFSTPGDNGTGTNDWLLVLEVR